VCDKKQSAATQKCNIDIQTLHKVAVNVLKDTIFSMTDNAWYVARRFTAMFIKSMCIDPHYFINFKCSVLFFNQFKPVFSHTPRFYAMCAAFSSVNSIHVRGVP